ncbi:MAG: conjugal transfer protein TraI [Williamsia sp.]|nr:conjugal transfer protein TraI [Williamsia sp.]
MRKAVIATGILLLCQVVPSSSLRAQDPVTEAIKAAVIKVIKAIDLQVQRIQTRTIWLQNAQKVVENKMSELRLDEITGWVEKQRQLYQDYFDELSKVKSVISGFSEVRGIIDRQKQLVSEYRQAYGVFQEDKNFTPEEISYMYKVYSGILGESLKNVDQLFLVINSLTTQMSDAKRLEIIHQVAEGIETNLSDLRQFNTQNKVIALQRANEKKDIDQLRKLHALPY